MRSLLLEMPGDQQTPLWSESEQAAVLNLRSRSAAPLAAAAIGIAGALSAGLAWLAPQIGALRWLQLGTPILAAGLLIGPGRRLVSARPNTSALAVLVPAVCVMGAALSPEPTSIPWLFMLAYACGGLALPMPERIATTLGLTGLCLGVTLSTGEPLSAELPSQISFLAFVVVMSIVNGHSLMWGTDRAALQRVRIAEREARLRALRDDLAARVSQQEVELKALSTHLRTLRQQESDTLGAAIRQSLLPELETVRLAVESSRRRSVAPSPDLTAVHGALRRLLHRLQPRIIDQLGLEGALHWLAADAERRVGEPLAVSLAPNLDAHPVKLQRLAYLTARDALDRAALAGRPGAWSLEVYPAPAKTALVVEVMDDGPCIWSPDDAGIAFLVLRERVHAIGGRVEWRLRGGRSLLRAVVPVEES